MNDIVALIIIKDKNVTNSNNNYVQTWNNIHVFFLFQNGLMVFCLFFNFFINIYH